MYVNRADLIKQHTHGPCEGLDALWDPAGLRTRAFAAGATGQALPYGIALQDLPACAAYCNLDIHIYIYIYIHTMKTPCMNTPRIHHEYVMLTP